VLQQGDKDWVVVDDCDIDRLLPWAYRRQDLKAMA